MLSHPGGAYCPSTTEVSLKHHKVREVDVCLGMTCSRMVCMVWWCRRVNRQPMSKMCTRCLDGTAHSLSGVEVEIGEAESLDGREGWGWCVERAREVRGITPTGRVAEAKRRREIT